MLAGRLRHNDAPAKLNPLWPNEDWVGRSFGWEVAVDRMLLFDNVSDIC